MPGPVLPIPAAEDDEAFLRYNHATGTITWALVAEDGLLLPEIVDPSAPAANNAVVYAKDVAGKTLLVTRFANGSIVPVASDDGGLQLTPTPELVDGASAFKVTYNAPQTGWADVDAVRPIHLETAWNATDVGDMPNGGPPANAYQGITSTLLFGSHSPAVAARGTVHNFSARQAVLRNSDPESEHAAYFGFLRYENGQTGRAWFTDWNLHGPVGVQPQRLVGITMFVNNYYDGNPADTPSAGQWIVTKEGSGGGGAAEHTAATTYPVQVGLGIIGQSGPSGIRRGFQTALQIGGGGAWGVPGTAGSSRIGDGIDIADFETRGIYIRRAHPGVTGTPNAIIVAPNAGAVGVGIETPSAMLHVRRVDAGGTVFVFDAVDGGNSHSAFAVGQGRSRFGYDATTGQVLVDDNGTNKSVSLRSGGAERFRISSDGRVGFFGTAGATQAAATADIKDALTAYGLLQGTSATPLNLDGGVLSTGYVELPAEQGADPAAPAANGLRLYTKDVGGKTQLAARFNTGPVQPVAQEGGFRTAFSDVNQTATASDRVLAQTGTLTAARVVTLPAANSVPGGTMLQVVDESGSASGTNTISWARAGSDTINGGTGNVVAVNAAYGNGKVMSDGTSKWTVV